MDKGTVLSDRFEVLSLLGQGGMGKVYRVLDRTNDQELALKLLITTRSSAASAGALFKREFELLLKLNHPHLISVHEFFEDGDRSFYTMELIKGGSLKDWIAQSHVKDMPDDLTDSALTILLQLAKALVEVHKHGIIHHDLKPENVLILGTELPSSEPKVKLVDFGTALLKEQQSEDQIRVGTLHYKSPEHSRGNQLDFSADIYSFGILAYELLTGKKPFDLHNGEGVNLSFAVTAMHALRDVPTVKVHNKKIAYQVNRMVQICLEKEPQHRYQSMGELVERLEDLLMEVG